jgi:predicted nucleotidyltransferase/DNA-binding XRE family transcriptional regulator
MNAQTFTPEACRMARAKARLTQQALAARAGVSRATLINFEAGKGKPLNASVAAIRSALSEEGRGGAKPQSRLAVVLRKLQVLEHSLRKSGVEHMAVFGSVARMEDRLDSDLDLVVEIDPKRRFDIFDLAGIAGDLTRSLGIRVDVLERKSLKPDMKKRVEKDQIRVF